MRSWAPKVREPGLSGAAAALSRPALQDASTRAVEALPPAPLPPPQAGRSTPASAASIPHDSSVISFKASTVHASAQQSLVAIQVQRTPASRSRGGAFVWRVERGTAKPAIDYARIGPQRVSFIEGQSARTLFIPLISDPAASTPLQPRYFHVVLQPVAGGPAVGRLGRVTVIIDPTPTLAAAR